MKISSITPKNSYSCQFCGLNMNLEPKIEYFIEKGVSPLCSNRCVFRLYYKKIYSYKHKNLLNLAKMLQMKNYEHFSHQKLAYEVTKKYPKLTLSSINKQAQGSKVGSSILSQEHKTGSGSSKPSIRGFEPMSL